MRELALPLSGCAKARLDTPIQNDTNSKFPNVFLMCRDSEYGKKLQTIINKLSEKRQEALQTNCEVCEFIEVKIFCWL